MDGLFFMDSRFILFVVRVVLGVVMVYYGIPKIKDLRANANDFVEMGFKPGWLWGTMTALLEFLGGISMILGILASFWAAAFSVQMVVGTFWKIKVGKSFKNYSYNLQLLAMSLVILAFGSGSWALGIALFG